MYKKDTRYFSKNKTIANNAHALIIRGIMLIHVVGDCNRGKGLTVVKEHWYVGQEEAVRKKENESLLDLTAKNITNNLSIERKCY